MYIDRDKDGKITGVYACKQRDGQEELPDDSQEVLSFLAPDETRVALVKLLEIDAKSIRSMREMLAALPDAPKWLTDYEAQAKAEREKLP